MDQQLHQEPAGPAVAASATVLLCQCGAVRLGIPLEADPRCGQWPLSWMTLPHWSWLLGWLQMPGAVPIPVVHVSTQAHEPDAHQIVVLPDQNRPVAVAVTTAVGIQAVRAVDPAQALPPACCCPASWLLSTADVGCDAVLDVSALRASCYPEEAA